MIDLGYNLLILINIFFINHLYQSIYITFFNNEENKLWVIFKRRRILAFYFFYSNKQSIIIIADSSGVSERLGLSGVLGLKLEFSGVFVVRNGLADLRRYRLLLEPADGQRPSTTGSSVFFFWTLPWYLKHNILVKYEEMNLRTMNIILKEKIGIPT